jgi:hypothetical protein
VKLHNPWYGAAFFHTQSALYDDVMRYVRVGVGFSGLYLFVIKDDKVASPGGVYQPCAPSCIVLARLHAAYRGIVSIR